MLSLLLKLVGFSKYTNASNVRIKSPKYALITGKLTTKDMNNTIKKFNNPENKYGEYISVILGSSVISEGYSLRNVQTEIILQPHWNFAETEQAIARGIRYGSHEELTINNPDYVPTVNIYLLTSIFEYHSTVSKEAEMYTISQSKLLKIDVVKNIIRENAFDCSLNYERNISNSKEKYTCKGVEPFNKIDYNTYNTFYSKKYIERYIPLVKKFFSLLFHGDILIIKSSIEAILYNTHSAELSEENKVSVYQLLETLQYMIDNMIPVKNRFSVECYISVENNIFFLTDRLNLPMNIYNLWYNKNPFLKVNTSYETTFNNLLNKVSGYDLIDNILNKSQADSYSIQDIRKVSRSLELNDKFYLLVSAINKEYVTPTTYSKKVLEYYKGYILHKPDRLINTMLYNNTDKNLRTFFLSTKTWDISSDEDQFEYEMYLREIKSNKFKIYGVYNVDLDTFCLSVMSPRKFKKSQDKLILAYSATKLNIRLPENLTKQLDLTQLQQDRIFINMFKQKKKEEEEKQEILDIKEEISNMFIQGDVNQLRILYTWLTVTKDILNNALLNFISNVNEEDCTDDVIEILDKITDNKPSKGRNIMTIDLDVLRLYASTLEAISVDPNFTYDLSTENVTKTYKKLKGELIEQLKELNENQIKTFHYIANLNLQKDVLVPAIKNKLMELNLIIHNYKCGVK